MAGLPALAAAAQLRCARTMGYPDGGGLTAAERAAAAACSSQRSRIGSSHRSAQPSARTAGTPRPMCPEARRDEWDQAMTTRRIRWERRGAGAPAAASFPDFPDEPRFHDVLGARLAVIDE